VLKDPTKTKQLRKALDDMAEEGVTQVFYPEIGSNWIIGVVGQLQLDVLLSRLDAEYKVAAGLEPAPFETARWVSAEDPKALEEFMSLNRGAMAKDRDGNPVFLAKSAWEVGYIADRYSTVKFAATRER
jgi:peptide chain release factor 3